jgi:hypothetical protein
MQFTANFFFYCYYERHPPTGLGLWPYTHSTCCHFLQLVGTLHSFKGGRVGEWCPLCHGNQGQVLWKANDLLLLLGEASEKLEPGSIARVFWSLSRHSGFGTHSPSSSCVSCYCSSAYQASLRTPSPLEGMVTGLRLSCVFTPRWALLLQACASISRLEELALSLEAQERNQLPNLRKCASVGEPTTHPPARREEIQEQRWNTQTPWQWNDSTIYVSFLSTILLHSLCLPIWDLQTIIRSSLPVMPQLFWSYKH